MSNRWLLGGLFLEIRGLLKAVAFTESYFEVSELEGKYKYTHHVLGF